jgi:hypothetical protein
MITVRVSTVCEVSHISRLIRGFTSKADIYATQADIRFVPCVDGSELARAFFTFAALVGAATTSFGGSVLIGVCIDGIFEEMKKTRARPKSLLKFPHLI